PPHFDPLSLHDALPICTRVGRAFLDFAAYPYTYVDKKEDGVEVVMRDLRYEYGTLKIRKGAVARVRLDERLNVVNERFSFRDSEDRKSTRLNSSHEWIS